MIKEMIGKIAEGKDLSFEESKAVMEEIMEGNATEVQIGSFITALRMKGETVDEITGCVSVMREKATHINVGNSIVVDTCGTGGDAKCTFNISTCAAFAGCGELRTRPGGLRRVGSISARPSSKVILG
jgi:anthranilate phosphoribosyltransferase